MYTAHRTGKSLSEALIFASTNRQYDDRLFIELQVQYMKIPNSNLGEHVLQKEELLTKIYLYILNFKYKLVTLLVKYSILGNPSVESFIQVSGLKFF